MLATRAGMPDLRDPTAPLRWLNSDGPLIAYRRGSALVALNTSERPQRLDTTEPFDVRFVSTDGPVPQGRRLIIPPEAALLAAATHRP